MYRFPSPTSKVYPKDKKSPITFLGFLVDIQPLGLSTLLHHLIIFSYFLILFIPFKGCFNIKYFTLSFFFLNSRYHGIWGSQARGQIAAVATGLQHHHSNTGSELHLQPMPQLTAVPDP